MGLDCEQRNLDQVEIVSKEMDEVNLDLCSGRIFTFTKLLGFGLWRW